MAASGWYTHGRRATSGGQMAVDGGVLGSGKKRVVGIVMEEGCRSVGCGQRAKDIEQLALAVGMGGERWSVVCGRRGGEQRPLRSEWWTLRGRGGGQWSLVSDSGQQTVDAGVGMSMEQWRGQERKWCRVSARCSDEKPSSVPTFARTEPPDTQVTKSILSLLKYYDWKKFAVIWEEPWEAVAMTLMRQAKELYNSTITHQRQLQDPAKCCISNEECCRNTFWYQIINESKNITRIYVFLGLPRSLVNMMKQMHDLRLFDKGEYMVITADMMPYTHRETLKFVWDTVHMNNITCTEDAVKRGRSLFIVGLTPPTSHNYQVFADTVEHYNALPPFNFTTPHSLKIFRKHITIYASYLYDSVLLYADALHTVLENKQREGVLTAQMIESLAKNGTLIIQTVKDRGQYTSITGAVIKIDHNGDSEGNFSVIALVPEPIQDANYTCDFHFRPIGTFSFTDNSKLHCPDDSRSSSMYAAATLAVLLFCALVVTLSIYRKWKIEQEIEGLLWKIDRLDLHGYFGNDIVASPSKVSEHGRGGRSRGGAATNTSTGLDASDLMEK
ncbi:Guanylate cyclase [Gryllus bimaculatus]|nr:Guanylate cyclase [Gryllus bimaculatus]